MVSLVGAVKLKVQGEVHATVCTLLGFFADGLAGHVDL